MIIHRAILGSCERFIAIITENFGGKWPFWLSPRQVMLIPVHESFCEHVTQLRDRLFAAGFEADVNVDMSETFNKKIRNAQVDQYNFILVVGEKEIANDAVNVRTRDNKVGGNRVQFSTICDSAGARRGEDRRAYRTTGAAEERTRARLGERILIENDDCCCVCYRLCVIHSPTASVAG